MADQDYPHLYAELEQSATAARAASGAMLEVIGGAEDSSVPVPGYGDQKTIAGRVADRLGELTQRIDTQIVAGGRIFETIEDGIQATEDGQYFYTVSADPWISRVLRKRISVSESTVISQDPAASGVLAIYDNIGFDEIVHDEDGYIYEFAALNDHQILCGFGKNFLFLGEMKIGFDGTGAFSVMDSVGRTALHIDKKGILVHPKMNSTAESVGVSSRLKSPFYADVMHIPFYGQSLSRGSVGAAPISTTQPYENITLAGGVNALPFMDIYDGSAFKPLIEESLAESPSKNETPASATCNELTRRILDANSMNVASEFVFLSTSGGWGGQTVESLAGNNRLPFFLQQITDAHATAKALGRSYNVPAYIWIQGEAQHNSDPFDSPPFSTRTIDSFVYGNRVYELYETVIKHIQSLTGQRNRPFMVTYQTGAHRTYSRSVMPVALSQWRDSVYHDDVVLAAPVYMMPTSPDNVHLTPEGSWLLGAYIGRAVYESLYSATSKWRPLEPQKVIWKETHIDISFHVPYGELVLDDALCSLAPNAGFDVWEDEVSPIENAISSVEVISEDTVRITLTAPTSLTATVSYARGRDGSTGGPTNGPRGNLRDTHGTVDTATSPLGNNFALHNACVMFQYNRKRGF